jgi:hypothetical protein
MKQLILCLALTVIGISTITAQDGERIFKRFKGDVSLGYAQRLGNEGSGGVLFAMEPKFAIIDQLSVGLRIEGAIMSRAISSNNVYSDDDAVFSGSYVATADYYFTNNYSIRPFAGAGVGVFSVVSDLSDYYDNDLSYKLGGIVRAGVEIKHFRFGLEYNMTPEVSIYLPGSSSTTLSKTSYIGIKAGFCFGGGPR